METIGFRSTYPDIDEVCAAQIDQIFPRGSQSRHPDGTIPLARIAALGFHGLSEAVRLTPLEVQRIAGEMDVLAEKDGVARVVAGRICDWLSGHGQRVNGWPPPPRQFPAVNTFSAMADRNKARSLIETIEDGHRALYKQERDWLVAVLRKID